jgi:hypothetical protein
VRAKANQRAIWALILALAALGGLAAAVVAAWRLERVGVLEAAIAAPVAGLLALLAVGLARGARWEHQRTLGRTGGAATAAVARVLGLIAFLIALTAGLALAVYLVLEVALT